MTGQPNSTEHCEGLQHQSMKGDVLNNGGQQALVE